jgi:dCTP deaminase
MAFWSGEKLAARLPSLLGQHFDPMAVKSARYTLRIGAEVFVTSSRASGGPRKGVTIRLNPSATFKIPPGQFAFLLTEEEIQVPADALAFISIRTNLKFRGLVNVSGFHVDPGWKGHLKFGIYNAGPADVHLRRGEEMFLIWYADLDRTSEKLYVNRPSKGEPHIPQEYANNMASQMYSPQVLAGQIRSLKTNLLIVQLIAVAILGGLITVGIKNWLSPEPKSPNTPVVLLSQPASPTLVSAPAAPDKGPVSTQYAAPQPLQKDADASHNTAPTSTRTPDKKNSTDGKATEPQTK